MAETRSSRSPRPSLPLRFPILLPMLLAAALPAAAADPPVPGWEGSVGAGLSWTSGNSDTRSYNLGLDFVHRGTALRNVWKIHALVLRGESDGEAIVDKQEASVRDQYAFGERLFAFGQVGYLADELKGLDHAIDATVGAGWKVVKNDAVVLALDAGVGAIRERYAGFDAETDATVRAGQALEWAISETASLTQTASGLWKLEETEDAVYHGELALDARITAWSKLRVAVADDYRTRPPDPDIEKNDMSVVMSLVFEIKPAGATGG